MIIEHMGTRYNVKKTNERVVIWVGDKIFTRTAWVDVEDEPEVAARFVKIDGFWEEITSDNYMGLAEYFDYDFSHVF